MTHSRDSNWRPSFLEGERLGLPLAALVWGAREPCNGPVDPGLLATSGGHGRSGWWRDTGSGSSDERSVPSREVLPLRAGRRLGWGRGLASREGPELQVFVPASLFPAIFGSRFLDAWDKVVRMTCKRRGQSVPDPLDPFAPPDGSCAPGVAFWGVTTERFRAVRPCATVRRGPDPARELTVCRPGYEPAGTAGARSNAACGPCGTAHSCCGIFEVFRRPARCGSPSSPSIPDSPDRPRPSAFATSCAKAGRHGEAGGGGGQAPGTAGGRSRSLVRRGGISAHIWEESPNRLSINRFGCVKSPSSFGPPRCQHGRNSHDTQWNLAKRRELGGMRPTGIADAGSDRSLGTAGADGALHDEKELGPIHTGARNPGSPGGVAVVRVRPD